jgi:hypothetical protein
LIGSAAIIQGVYGFHRSDPMPLLLWVGRFSPLLTQDARLRVLEQSAKMDRDEAKSAAKGRPWTEDDAASLDV